MLSGWLAVADGDAGIQQIVGKLTALKNFYGATPAIRRAAIMIAGGVVNDDDRGNAARLASFVRRALVYVKDPLDAEFIQAPDVLLLEITRRGRAHGDCDDHVLLYSSLAQSLGIPTEVAGVVLPPATTFNHVIAISNIDAEAIEVDLCAKHGFQPAYPRKLFA